MPQPTQTPTKTDAPTRAPERTPAEAPERSYQPDRLCPNQRGDGATWSLP